MNLLLLNGGNPQDELIMLGLAILITWLVVKFTRRNQQDDADDGQGSAPDDPR